MCYLLFVFRNRRKLLNSQIECIIQNEFGDKDIIRRKANVTKYESDGNIGKRQIVRRLLNAPELFGPRITYVSR